MNRYPYRRVRIGGRQYYVHRLVYELAHGRLPADWVVHHRNEDWRDNRVENLHALPRPDHCRHHLIGE